MGSQLSRLKTFRSWRREFMFDVVIYLNGVCQGTGKLQIADGKIILYQKDSKKLVWMIRSLRRYGSEKPDIFSFESGRRCDTGPATYVFNTKPRRHLGEGTADCGRDQNGRR